MLGWLLILNCFVADARFMQCSQVIVNQLSFSFLANITVIFFFVWWCIAF